MKHEREEGGEEEVGRLFLKIKPVGRLNVELLEYWHIGVGAGFFIY